MQEVISWFKQNFPKWKIHKYGNLEAVFELDSFTGFTLNINGKTNKWTWKVKSFENDSYEYDYRLTLTEAKKSVKGMSSSLAIIKIIESLFNSPKKEKK